MKFVDWVEGKKVVRYVPSGVIHNPPARTARGIRRKDTKAAHMLKTASMKKR